MKKLIKKTITAILLSAMLLFGLMVPEKAKADIAFTGELFSKPSTEYNDALANMAAEFCDKAQGESSSSIEKTLNKYGIKNKAYNYGESAAFVVGHKKVKIDGEKDATVLIVIARGSQTLPEYIGDAAKESKVKKMLKKGKSVIDSIMQGNSWKRFVKEFNNAGEYRFLYEEVYHNVYDFEEKVWKGLNEYLDDNSAIENDKNLKILVTGHSLGGAAANMIAAKLDFLRKRGEWISNLEKEDIYCYTFGAIKVLTRDVNIEENYENIFNIYNKYDSFGPKGNFKVTNASHPKAKFGYTLEYDKLKDKEIAFSWNNHDMGGNYKKAVEKGFVKEAAKKMGFIKTKRRTGLNSDIKVGSSVYFGRYEQDGNTKNGKEPIEWKVLDKKGKKVLLISKDILDVKPYYNDKLGNIWQDSTLRYWLNKDFYDLAFSYKEKKKIVFNTEKNENNDTDYNNIKDKIFFLSNDEVGKYFNSNEERIASLTEYSFSELKRVGLLKGYWDSEEKFDSWFDSRNKIEWGLQWLWWLRSPGNFQNRVSRVDRDGSVLYDGDFCDNECVGICPAIWVNL